MEPVAQSAAPPPLLAELLEESAVVLDDELPPAGEELSDPPLEPHAASEMEPAAMSAASEIRRVRPTVQPSLDF